MFDNDFYEEYIKSKQRRKGKKSKRNPIVSSHGRGGDWGSGPMVSDKGRKKPKYVERFDEILDGIGDYEGEEL